MGSARGLFYLRHSSALYRSTCGIGPPRLIHRVMWAILDILCRQSDTVFSFSYCETMLHEMFNFAFFFF